MKINKSKLIENLAKELYSKTGNNNSLVIAESVVKKLVKEDFANPKQAPEIIEKLNLKMSTIYFLVKEIAKNPPTELYQNLIKPFMDVIQLEEDAYGDLVYHS
jgi:hypothetical protein